MKHGDFSHIGPLSNDHYYHCDRCGSTHTTKHSHFRLPSDLASAPESPLTKQEGGSHYKDLKIQPIEYIHANGISFAEGCAIKYLTRWRSKGGVEDLKKAKHFIELLIELETRDARKTD